MPSYRQMYVRWKVAKKRKRRESNVLGELLNENKTDKMTPDIMKQYDKVRKYMKLEDVAFDKMNKKYNYKNGLYYSPYAYYKVIKVKNQKKHILKYHKGP